MSELKVTDFGEASALAARFNQAAGNLEELIQFCSTASSELQGVWEGASSTNFVSEFEETKAALLKIQPILAELQNDANNRLAALQAANQ